MDKTKHGLPGRSKKKTIRTGEIKRRQLKSRIWKLPIPGDHVFRRKSRGNERGEEHCHLPYPAIGKTVIES
jgi:hypothetical protein